MAKAEFENRKLRTCLWIVTQLKRHEALTFEELNRCWLRETAVSGGAPLQKRTFRNYLHAIQDMLGVIVECERHTYRYRIVVESDSDFASWLISSFSVGLLSEETKVVRDRILFDAPPRGMEHWTLLVEAFRRGCCVEILYQKFDAAAPQERRLQPYCLKSYGGRWYLLAARLSDPEAEPKHALSIYALDRVKRLSLLDDQAFVPPADFQPQRYFADSFGVWVGDAEPEEIRLRVSGTERHYLRTQPLHHSQREVPLTVGSPGYAPDTSLFVLHCRPTRDLLLALLAHGRNLEVVAPEAFRQAVAEEARAIAAHYATMKA